MTSSQKEKELLSQHLMDSVSVALQQYAADNPSSQLNVEDVRDVLAKIIDYLDIAEITGFGPWKDSSGQK